MRKLITLLVLFILFGQALAAEAPAYEISVAPTVIAQSWYDYMIGCYMDTPVAVQDASHGQDIYMLYQAITGSYASQRKIYLARVDTSGALELNMDYWHLQAQRQGFGSVKVDAETGWPLFVWHEAVPWPDNDNCLDIPLVCSEMSGIQIPEWQPFLVVDNPVPYDAVRSGEFIWPTISIGPSPTAGLRRAYILGRNRTGGEANNHSPNVLLAYADFSTDDLYNGSSLNWNYTSVPEMNDWYELEGFCHNWQGTLACGDDGRVYLLGWHSEYAVDSIHSSQFLTVFINDSYGSGAWRRISVSAAQLPSPVNDQIASWDPSNIYFIPFSSNHFNVVWDRAGRLHFPLLYTGTEGGYSWHTTLFSVRDIWFDTASESFSIHDLFPRGATPHSDPCYTPWDVDEDHWVDELVDGYPVYTTYFPFPHWDTEESNGAMMTQQNNVKMSFAESGGAMACVWADSRARQQDSGVTGPQIYISVSPDNGYTWLDPIVLDHAQNPALGETMTFVYPADRMIDMGVDDSGNRVLRLFLLYFDDSVWWVANTSPGPGPYYGEGNVCYLALDIHLPVLGTPGHEQPPAPGASMDCSPNPFRGSVRLNFSLERGKDGSEARLCVYNLRGQLLRSFPVEAARNGQQSLSWDGADASGKPCPSGVYLVSLQQGGRRLATRKLSLIK